MLELVGISNAVTFLRALVALALLLYGLKWFDSRFGKPWAENVKTIEGNPIALSIWTSSLWIGGCLFLGLVWSG